MDFRNSEILRGLGSLAERWEPAARARERVARAIDRLRSTSSRTRKRACIAAGAALVIGGVALYLVVRPTPTPDYEYAELDDLFDFTLLQDEFNRLPVDRRLELVRQLIDRVKGMSAGESALLAAFAAGVKGKMREQLVDNLSNLALDVWDKYAQDYADGYQHLPENERAAYLDKTFVEFTRMMETLAGEESDQTDEERLADAREQARREEDRRNNPDFQPSGQGFGRAFEFMREDVGKNAAPAQRARGQLLLRDMTRRFRGEGLDGPR